MNNTCIPLKTLWRLRNVILRQLNPKITTKGSYLYKYILKYSNWIDFARYFQIREILQLRTRTMTDQYMWKWHKRYRKLLTILRILNAGIWWSIRGWEYLTFVMEIHFWVLVTTDADAHFVILRALKWEGKCLEFGICEGGCVYRGSYVQGEDAVANRICKLIFNLLDSGYNKYVFNSLQSLDKYFLT